MNITTRGYETVEKANAVSNVTDRNFYFTLKKGRLRYG